MAPPLDSKKLAALLHRVLPITRIVSSYTVGRLVNDLLAGLTVAVLIVPHSIAQASLASMPPQAGLYSAIATSLVYGLFGPSRTLAVGPVALTAIISATGVTALNLESPWAFAAAVSMVAVVAGFFQMTLGLLRLGFLTQYLSVPMLRGLLTAIACIIALNEVDHLLGIDVPRQPSTVQLVSQLWQSRTQVEPESLLLGLGGISLLLLIRDGLPHLLENAVVPAWVKSLAPNLGPLVVVILGAGAVSFFDLRSVQVVGALPRRLLAPALPIVEAQTMIGLLRTGLTVGLLSYVQSIVMARHLANRTNHIVANNQELVALGLANVASGMLGGFAVAGSVSRSMVNYSAGARTGIASIATGGALVIGVLVAAPLFGLLPYPILAAIVIAAVSTLLDVQSLLLVWRCSRAEAAVWIITFVVVLAAGIEQGLLVGVVVALVLAFWQQQGWGRSVEEIALTCSQARLLRLPSHLTLLTVPMTVKVVNDIANNDSVTQIVIDCQQIVLADYTASATLKNTGLTLNQQGVSLHWAAGEFSTHLTTVKTTEMFWGKKIDPLDALLHELGCAKADDLTSLR